MSNLYANYMSLSNEGHKIDLSLYNTHLMITMRTC